MTTTATQIDLPVGTWALDKAHSSVSFVARHLMVTKVRGSFHAYDGKIEVAENPADTAIDIEIEASSVTTGSPDRDGHLISPDFFDVAKYPTLRFVSTDIRQRHGDWEIVGDLTIKDITKPVTLDVAFHGTETNPWGKTIAAFTATAEVDREAWGLTWNVSLESGGLLVSKKIKLEIEAQLIKA